MLSRHDALPICLRGGLAQDGPLLRIARLIEGCGFVLTVVCAPSLLTAASYSGQRALVLGFWSAYMPLGVALGMLGALPVGRLFDWRDLWFGLAILLAVAAKLGRASCRARVCQYV